MFRRDLQVDLGVLARSLVVINRYWMDHLRETEFETALVRLASLQAIEDAEGGNEP